MKSLLDKQGVPIVQPAVEGVGYCILPPAKRNGKFLIAVDSTFALETNKDIALVGQAAKYNASLAGASPGELELAGMFTDTRAALAPEPTQPDTAKVKLEELV